MLNIKSLAVLAIVGSATALPQLLGNYLGGGEGNYDGNNNNNKQAVAVEYVTEYTTITVPGGFWGGNAQTATATVSASSSSSPTPDFTYAPPSSAPQVAAASSPAAVASSAPVVSSNTGYMAIVDEWRSKLGLDPLTQDSTLEANALKTCNDGNGQMVHELNPGSFAQVLAPGDADEFEHVFVGGWLCEEPNLSGLNGICATQSAGWSYGGQTGHAEILTDKKYKKIGCALAKGIWGCDLA